MSDGSKRIQLVIPMAGLGSRFTEAGYNIPKPLLPIHDVPMYKVVIANLMHESVLSVTIICPRPWGLAKELMSLEEQLGVRVNVIEIDYVTEGPAKTVALASPFLEPDLPVVTANSDQYIDADFGDFYNSLSRSDFGGGILCMEDSDPRWSYVKLSSEGFVAEVREKEVISHLATVGVYGFTTAVLMMNAFQEMFDSKDTVSGEFYVAPSYSYIVRGGQKVSVANLGPVGAVMHGLGIPVDYEAFLKLPISHAARDNALRILPI